MIDKEQCNPVKPLPYTEGAFDTFQKYGYFMFPQQRKIYDNIARRINPHSTVLEVGCGIGLGTALLDRSLTTKVTGTDNLIENVNIAKALYPWIKFERMDICKANNFRCKYDSIVAVEVLEHVENPVLAVREMCWHSLKEVWISTPNGAGKKRPPDNPYHVCEFTIDEVIAMIPKGWLMRVLDYETFEEPKDVTKCDPLVYHLTKRV